MWRCCVLCLAQHYIRLCWKFPELLDVSESNNIRSQNKHVVNGWLGDEFVLQKQALLK